MRWISVAVLAACSSSAVTAPHALDAAAIAVDAQVGDAPVRAPDPTTRLPDGATPLAYDLRLDIDPAADTFKGRVEIRVKLARATDRVWLHAERLVIVTAKFTAGAQSGALVDLAIANDHAIRGFSFGGTVPAGEVVLAFDYTGKIALDEPEGLFRQQHKGRWYVFAQSESVFARRIVPCFDEPRFKTTWRVRVGAPAGNVVVGNGAVVGTSESAVQFAEIARMPSYLLSVAVGPFAIVDLGKLGSGGLPARVIALKNDQTSVGVVAAKLPAIVDALERYLGEPLPIAKLDLVSVPHFFGAMENIGLITFESNILVGDPKNQWLWRRFIRFAAHELAHQWFGNLVTHAWWDDLWLAEGFATWLGDKIGDELGAANDPALRRQLGRLHAFTADDAPAPRPLRRPLDAGDVEERFDAIAYEKGGAVLDALEDFVGADKFRDAIRSYVHAHAGGTATSHDVVDALKPIAPDAAGALAAYLDMTGAPVVTLTLDCATSKLAIRASAGTVPVCVRYPDGATVARACIAATPSGSSLTLPSCPAWVIGNAGGIGYYHVADPALAVAAPVTPSERLTIASDLGAGLVRGDVTLAAALAEVRAGVARDPVSRLGAVMIANAIDPLVEDALRPSWVKWLTRTFAKRAYAARLAVPAPTISVIEGEARSQLRDMLDDKTGTRGGFDKIVARAKLVEIDQQADVLETLGYYGAGFVNPVVDIYLGGTFKPSRVWPAVENMLERADTRTAMWHALRDRIAKVLAILSPAELDKLIEATRNLCDAASRSEVIAAFTGKVADADAKLARAVAGIDQCIARRARLGDLATALAP